MGMALVGLRSTLDSAECVRVELRGSAGDEVLVFERLGPDEWASAEEADALSTDELLGAIQQAFGERFSALACVLAHEEVEYEIEGDAVRTRRVPRTERDGAAAPDLTPIAEALGIPRSKRKEKFKQARHFARIVETALKGAERSSLRVLDLACGRSYLGFVLVQLLAARGRAVTLHGVDSDVSLVAKARQIAETLRWSDSTFEVADLATYSAEPDAYDVAVSLHGCDTLTDEVIRIGWEARVPLLFVAPCCQHELRHQWKDHPLDWMSRYGLLEQQLADVVTDGFRCLVLEALGYRVKVIRFADRDVTPKNLLIQARLTSGPREGPARKAEAFLEQFGVSVRLAEVLRQSRTQGSP